MQRIYWLLLVIVIVGHIIFAAMQWLYWPLVVGRLFGIEDETIVEKISGIGTSFASYNFSIAVGLALSTRLALQQRQIVQMVVLGLIVFTATVGYIGTDSPIILLGRLLPASLALIVLLRLKL